MFMVDHYSVVVGPTHYELDSPRSNPGGSDIFRSCPNRSLGPHACTDLVVALNIPPI